MMTMPAPTPTQVDPREQPPRPAPPPEELPPREPVTPITPPPQERPEPIQALQRTT
jgi:hypothetical protein